MRDFFWRLPTLRCAAVSVLTCLASCAMAATGLSWKQGSDLLAVGLPALAAGAAWGQGDTEGLRQLSWALGTTVVATEATKAAFPSQRPDGSDDKSFPSGHTAVAFAAVRFMDKRYGAEMAPYTPWLYAAAGLTGWARVEARKHRFGDVAAGAALGFGAAHYWTEPDKGGQLSVLPAAQGLAVMWHRPW